MKNYLEYLVVFKVVAFEGNSSGRFHLDEALERKFMSCELDSELDIFL